MYNESRLNIYLEVNEAKGCTASEVPIIINKSQCGKSYDTIKVHAVRQIQHTYVHEAQLILQNTARSPKKKKH